MYNKASFGRTNRELLNRAAPDPGRTTAMATSRIRERGPRARQSPTRHGVNHWQGRPDWLDEELSHSSWLAEEAIRFLTRKRDPDCPFFLHLSFVHPHPPLTPPQPYWNKYASRVLGAAARGEWVGCPPWQPDQLPASNSVGPFRPDAIRDARTGYFGLVEHVDSCIAHVLDSYREYGCAREQEPLYVLFTSDHGEMLGDHELFGKSVPYEASSHVPMFVSGFNVPLQAGRSENLVTLEDVMPTLLDLAGVECPPGIDGHSLAGGVSGGNVPAREVVEGVCGPHHFVRWDDWKYLYWPLSGQEQCFNLREDPEEKMDLSGDGAPMDYPRKRMRERVRRRLGINRPEFVPPGGRPPSVFWPQRRESQGKPGPNG
jgi:arylsulfatase A-like enzyme